MTSRPVKSAAPSARTPALASARPLHSNLSATYPQAREPESGRLHKHLLRTHPQAGASFQQVLGFWIIPTKPFSAPTKPYSLGREGGRKRSQVQHTRTGQQ
jgi:hypothetical protein